MNKLALIQPKNTKKLLDWKQINKEWEKTTISQRRFCKINNLTYAAFKYWRKKILQNEDFEHKKETFKEIKVIGNEQKLTKSAQEVIKIHLPGNITINIPAAMNNKIITAIFKSLCGVNYA